MAPFPRSLLTGLYVILDPAVAGSRSLPDLLEQAADAGVRLFQYRDKQASMREAYRQALALRDAASRVAALLVINDRCDLALAVEADGVHLGQQDLPPADARRLLGPDRLIGLSVHHAAQVRTAAREPVDYLGFGPIHATTTKADHEPVVGVEGLRAVRSLTTLPLFAIGGITSGSARELREAGADGVAVASALLRAADFQEAVRRFMSALA